MNDDNYYDYNDDDWTEYVEDDYDDDYSDDYNSDDDLMNNIDPIYDTKQLPPLLWVKVKINDEIIEVSSQGRIKLKEDILHSTDGTIQPGTPFKYIKIGNNKYYVHHLVWSSFNGLVPEGWEIRHKDEYVHRRKRKYYSNHLSNITIYPKNISEVNNLSTP